MTDWLNIIGAIGTIVMGLFGLLCPNAAANFVGLSAKSPEGQSEFRATYGGLWLPLGFVPILSQEPLAFLTAGLCWLGAAAGRLMSIFVDRANTRKNWLAVIFESAFGGALSLGAPIDTFLSL